jgi:hypothetical protein
MIRQGQDPQTFRKLKSFVEANGQIANIVEKEKFGSYTLNSGRLGKLVSIL